MSTLKKPATQGAARFLEEIEMPTFGSFERAEAYHRKLFHELGNATGHASRLNRSALDRRFPHCHTA